MALVLRCTTPVLVDAILVFALCVFVFVLFRFSILRRRVVVEFAEVFGQVVAPRLELVPLSHHSVESRSEAREGFARSVHLRLLRYSSTGAVRKKHRERAQSPSDECDREYKPRPLSYNTIARLLEYALLYSRTWYPPPPPPVSHVKRSQ